MADGRLPREVWELCRQMNVRPEDIVDYRLGIRQPRRMLNGSAFWVRPVMALTRSGVKYSCEVLDLNVDEEFGTWEGRPKRADRTRRKRGRT